MIFGTIGLKMIDLMPLKNAGWYIRSWAYDGPIASLEPFKYCQWSAKKLNK